MTVTRETFRDALGRLAAGVSLIATELDGKRRGITATAVCSVSDNPPTILACVNTRSGTAQMIGDRGWFSVNFLAESQQDIAEVFAGKGGFSGGERFQHGHCGQGQNGLPVLRHALASIECQVEKAVPSGTHVVFFGTVNTASLGAFRPLMYQVGQYRRLPGDGPVSHSPKPCLAESTAGV